ncbi:MAG: gliding motility-associated C-terminal domain-containing protein [Saprospiraceae bacterium]
MALKNRNIIVTTCISVRNYSEYILFISFMCLLGSSQAQNTIWTNPGKSHKNTDGPVLDSFSVDISNCSSVSFSMDYSFPLGWVGNGNMESPDECIFGCNGDPKNPSNGGCKDCWDFLYAELSLDGSVVYTELIGIVKETRSFGEIKWSGCTNGASRLGISIINQNWGSTEVNIFGNLKVNCRDGTIANIASLPTCVNELLVLKSSLSMPLNISKILWEGPGTISNPTSLNTTVEGAKNGDTYTLSVTDMQGCITSNSISAVIRPVVNPAFDEFISICKGQDVTLPLVSKNGISGFWSPAFDANVSKTYTFTPESDQCGSTFDLNITITDAGPDTSIYICKSTDTAIDLNTLLGKNVNPNGIWNYSGDSIINASQFDISSLNVGNQYFYYIINDPKCKNDSSLITIHLSKNHAGNDSNITLCSSSRDYVNFDSLTGLRDDTGYWIQHTDIDVDLTNTSDVDLSSLTPGSYSFEYIASDGICDPDTAFILIELVKNNVAGPDIYLNQCIGAAIDIGALVNEPFNGGIIDNFAMIPDINNNLWNTSESEDGSFFINYIFKNALPCPSDTAVINIVLQKKSFAGYDTLIHFTCEKISVSLWDYLNPNADMDGIFYLDNLPIQDGKYVIENTPNLTFKYIVGEGHVCLPDTSEITFTKNAKPLLNISAEPKICTGECDKIIINSNAGNGSKIYVTILGNFGQQYKSVFTLSDTINQSFEVCAKETGPYDFNNIEAGNIYTIFIDSLMESANECIYKYTDSITVLAISLPKRQIDPWLCTGQSLKIENDTYDSNHLSGSTIKNSENPETCDSLILVTLHFYDITQPTQINIPTCDKNFSFNIGNTTFDKSNPKGDVMLTNVNGCDSIVSVNLTFNSPSVYEFQAEFCNPDSVFIIAGKTFDRLNPSGNVILSGANFLGCDSIITVSIKFISPEIRIINQDICDEYFQFSVGNKIFNKNNPKGIVVLTKGSANGCDSIIDINLNYLNKSDSNVKFSTCNDLFNYKIENTIFDKSNPKGKIILTGKSINGCDSIINVELLFSDFSFDEKIISDCQNSDAVIYITNASHNGPFDIYIDGYKQDSLLNLPYNTLLNVGLHKIQLMNSAGCYKTVSVQVPEINKPKVDITKNYTSDGKTQILVVASIIDIYNLNWKPSLYLTCDNCFDPIADPPETTIFNLTYLYGIDCIGETNVEVEKINTEIIIPNIFSPDNDGINDIFYVQLPKSIHGKIKSMSIYDRWGNTVFSIHNVPANDTQYGWNGYFDGISIQPGVFIYYVELEVPGKEFPEKYTGTVTLIR